MDRGTAEIPSTARGASAWKDRPLRRPGVDAFPCAPVVVIDVLVDGRALVSTHLVGVAFLGKRPHEFLNGDLHRRPRLLPLAPVEGELLLLERGQ